MTGSERRPPSVCFHLLCKALLFSHFSFSTFAPILLFDRQTADTSEEKSP